jgi:hypothetical protein
MTKVIRRTPAEQALGVVPEIPKEEYGNMIWRARQGESFQIGDTMVTFLELNGTQIKLGISAPKSIRLSRVPTERRNG